MVALRMEDDWAGLSRYTWRYCAFLPHFLSKCNYLPPLVEWLGWTLQVYLKMVLSFLNFCPNVTKLSSLGKQLGWTLQVQYIWRYCSFLPHFLSKCNNLSPLVENDWAGLSRYTWRYCALLPHFLSKCNWPVSSPGKRLGWTLQEYKKNLLSKPHFLSLCHLSVCVKNNKTPLRIIHVPFLILAKSDGFLVRQCIS